MISVHETVQYLTGHLVGFKLSHHWVSGMTSDTLSQRLGQTYRATMTEDEYIVVEQRLEAVRAPQRRSQRV